MIYNAIRVGLIITLILGVGICITKYFWPMFYMKDYSEEIQKSVKLKNMTKNEKIISIIVTVFYYLLAIITLCMGVLREFPEEISYIKITFYIFIVYIAYNIFNLIIFDWIIFNTLTPQVIDSSGRKEINEYKNYLFNFPGLLKGIVVSLGMAIITSSIMFVVFTFFIW